MNDLNETWIGDDEDIGLLAGWGRFPILVAEALQKQGRRVHCIGIHGHADPILGDICHRYTTLGLARLGGQLRWFQRQKLRTATMAGKLNKTLMLNPINWLYNLPDWTCLKTFYPHFITRTRDCKDDTILSSVVRLFSQGGVEPVAATDLVPELLVKFGVLSRRQPSHFVQKDIEFGWEIAKAMGKLDIGQSVVVKSQAVVAVEAVEGTDECIRRAGELCQSGGFTVIKVAKPQQDMRFDVPTIGLQTLQTIVDAGGGTLVVEADKTIILDEPEVIEFANKHGIVVAAYDHATGMVGLKSA